MSGYTFLIAQSLLADSILNRKIWASETEVLVEADEDIQERLDAPWYVVLYNDEIHSFDEVILQLIKATQCTVQQAEHLAWTAHTKGKAGVYESDLEECLHVQGILRQIQLVTEIQG